MTKIVLSSAASILALVLAATGCGTTNSDAAGDAGPGTSGQDATVTGITSIGTTPLPCDVTAVLQSNCQTCHGSPTTNGAPMSLMTWEDLTAKVINDPDGVTPTSADEPVYQMVKTRIHDDANPMPQPPNARLSAEDTATLDTWIAAGAPKTDSVACTLPEGGPGVPDSAPPTITCNTDNVTLKASSPWTMPTDTDDQYTCYSVTVPSIEAGVTAHILGMTPHVDNHSIVHHILLFESDTADTSVTSVPAPCSAGGSLGWRIIYGWAPGGGAMQTPPGVGFPYTSTTQFIVQVHYNNINHLANQTDLSGFSFCTTEEPVANDADVMAFGSMKFTIPPNGSLGWTCPLTLGSLYDGIHVFAAFPHMHQLGTGIATEQTMAGGGIVDLGRNEPWNFNTQIWFPLGATLHQGDVVTTRCTWQNNTGSPVSFGQNTEQEMCYSFTAYYPKLSGLLTWTEPSLSNDSSGNCYATDAGLPTPDGGWVPQDSGAVVTLPDAGAGDD